MEVKASDGTAVSMRNTVQGVDSCLTKYGHVMREKKEGGEVGKVEKESPRKSAVLVARGIKRTIVRSFINIECSMVQVFVKTATPSLPPYLQNSSSKHGVCIREHPLKITVMLLIVHCSAFKLLIFLPKNISKRYSIKTLPRKPPMREPMMPHIQKPGDAMMSQIILPMPRPNKASI
uniref:Uncharacterized protein n=1 Tax=Timema cristinae TaxID=61476 RepID=A0A7R9DER8_TIMCR|nr:unnamed protein product [Timema cristinae]